MSDLRQNATAFKATCAQAPDPTLIRMFNTTASEAWTRGLITDAEYEYHLRLCNRMLDAYASVQSLTEGGSHE